MRAGRRFARLVTDAVTRRPALWRVFRGPFRRMFDRMAPEWDATRVTASFVAALEAALDRLEAPARILDVGTGTGAAARAAAARWPDADVTGVDLSPGMVAEATRLGGGERYEVADASSLPFPDGSFDLVMLLNAIPFYDELVRVLAPGGHLAVAYSRGPQTPIWVPFPRLRRELEARGLTHVADVEAGEGRALLAVRPPVS